MPDRSVTQAARNLTQAPNLNGYDAVIERSAEMRLWQISRRCSAVALFALVAHAHLTLIQASMFR
jgi:hypothetical protein